MENDENGAEKPSELSLAGSDSSQSSGSTPENSNDGATRVDLGDDLLAERTRTALFRPDARTSSSSSSSVPPRPPSDAAEIPFGRDARSSRGRAAFDADDEFASAKILLGEGLLEEAKKTLRRILVRDSQYAPAILALREIHENELKQIFGDDPQPRRRRYSSQDPEPAWEIPTAADAAEIARELDRDLRPGNPGGGASPLGELEDGVNAKELEAFAARLDEQSASLGGADRVDLGIGLHEMGLYGLAARQFRAAHRFFVRQETPDALATLGAGSLLARSLIAGGRAFEATQELQSMLREAETGAAAAAASAADVATAGEPVAPQELTELKVELFYLMGRAYEALGKAPLALQWYERAHGIDPFHRDVADRLRELRTG